MKFTVGKNGVNASEARLALAVEILNSPKQTILGTELVKSICHFDNRVAKILAYYGVVF